MLTPRSPRPPPPAEKRCTICFESFAGTIHVRPSIHGHGFIAGCPARDARLCSTFKDWKELPQKECLGFIVGEKYMRHYIYPIVRQDIVQAWIEQPISLYNRLTTQSRKSRLTRKERLQLALTLVSRVLQLHKTPSLSDHWDKNDILFLEGSSKPYVSKSFLPTGNVPLQDMYVWCFLSCTLRLMFQERWDIAACYFLPSRLHVSKSSQLTQDLPGMHNFPFAYQVWSELLFHNVWILMWHLKSKFKYYFNNMTHMSELP